MNITETVLLYRGLHRADRAALSSGDTCLIFSSEKNLKMRGVDRQQLSGMSVFKITSCRRASHRVTYRMKYRMKRQMRNILTYLLIKQAWATFPKNLPLLTITSQEKWTLGRMESRKLHPASLNTKIMLFATNGYCWSQWKMITGNGDSAAC